MIGEGVMLVLSTTLTLILVLDPFGNIPLFLCQLRTVAPEKRQKIVARELLIALLVLMGFLAAGGQLLAMFQISQSSLEIAGGVVMFIISIQMIFPAILNTSSGTGEPRSEPLIVPLAVPLVAGPAAMATLILLQAKEPSKLPVWALSAFLAWLVTAGILLVAGHLNRILGEKVIEAAERLMGMLLTTVAVEMLVRGVRHASTTGGG